MLEQSIMKIKYFTPRDDELKIVDSDIKHFFKNLEEPYNTEYQRRYKVLLNNPNSIIAFLFLNNKVEGIRLFIKVDGGYFGADEKSVYRGTLFRISIKHRNKGIGTQLISMTNRFIFDLFQIQRIYGESREPLALRLYKRNGAIFFMDDNLLKSTIESAVDNEKQFLDNDIPYYWEKGNSDEKSSNPTSPNLIWEQTYSIGDKESYRLRIDNRSLYVLTHPYYYAKKWVTTCGGLFLFEHLKSDNLEDAKKEAIAFLKKHKKTIAGGSQNVA